MKRKKTISWPRVLLIGLITLVVIVGLALVLRLVLEPKASGVVQKIDVLANSNDECVACHRNASPGIVQQYSYSAMAAAKVLCKDCHNVSQDYPGAKEHEGAYVLASPTTAKCEQCHRAEVAQYNASRHGLPAYVAVFGSKDFSPELMQIFQAIPEGQFAPDKARNAIAAMEGPEITRFACETCHNIGKPADDGSMGQCQKCHLRHEFSLEQARKPETCNMCHIGPDHPQWEIYHESPHGIAYTTMGYQWNWLAEPGMQAVKDIPAATCAVCHMSGFGATGTTHDVGDRLSWYLFASISERRPAWEDNLVRMQAVAVR